MNSKFFGKNMMGRELLMGISILFMTSFFVIGCGMTAEGDEEVADTEQMGEETSAEADTSKADKKVPINVKVIGIQPEVFDDVVDVVGTVKPMEDIMVASEEGGKVSRWYVRKGSYVKRGQTMVKLNDDLLRRQLEAAEAQYKIAKLNAEKSKEVFADAGAVSEVSVTTAQYNLDAADANVKLLKTRIAKTRVTAPVSGRIDEVLTDMGEMVSPGAAVARLIQTGTVKVSAGVPERYVEGLRRGLPVEMTFDAMEGRKVNGTISYIGSMVSEQSRAIPIEEQLRNTGGAFVPEMVVNLSILKDRLRNVVVIPRTALIRTETGYQVYVVVDGQGEKKHVVEARPVTIGPADRGVVVIDEGLKTGDIVITVGQSKVSPGEEVTFSLERAEPAS